MTATVETTKGRALILRTCDKNGLSSGGFQWPKSGHVEAPDWKPTRECGNGLHGALWGEGDGSLLSFGRDAVWIVAEVSEWIDLDGKVKFPSANVLHYGDRQTATDFIAANGAIGAVIGGTATAGYRGTATAGDGGTATAGYGGMICIKWHDGKRYRISVGYVGERGIKPNIAYRCVSGSFVPVDGETP